MIAQITLIVIWALSLGMTIVKHGEQKDTKYNGWHSIITIGIYVIILYYGGFWTMF